MADELNPGVDVESEAFKTAVSAAAGTQIEAAVKKAVEESAVGLMKTNADLKDEKKKEMEKRAALQEQLDAFGGPDGLEQLTEFKSRLENDEMGKLLAEGKTDEWHEKKTAALRGDHEAQVKALTEEIVKEKESSLKATARLQKMVLKTEVMHAAQELEVLSGAIDDVQRLAEGHFFYDEDSKPGKERVVLRDKEGAIVYGKDATTPKTVKEWLEEQKDTMRHYWPPSKGGGSGGSGPDGELVPGDKTYEDMNQAEFETQRGKELAASDKY